MAEMSEDNNAKTPEPQLRRNIKIKKEKVTPPPSPKKNADGDAALILSSIDNILDTALSAIKGEKDEKSAIEPVKSSNEILAELFQVFNSVPPDPLTASQEAVDSLLSKKKKKHSKHKKKHKKKGRSSSDDDEEVTDVHKHRKVKKEKKTKRKRDDSPSKPDEKRKVKREKHDAPTAIKVERESRSSHKRKRPPTNNDKSAKDATNLDIDIDEYEQKLLEETKKKSSSSSSTTKSSSAGQRSSKIVIKDLKHSAVYEETVSQVKAKEREKQKSDAAHEDGELSVSAHSRNSSISLSDEETYLRNKYSSSRSFNRNASSPSHYSGRTDRRNESRSNETSSRSYRDRERYHDRDNRSYDANRGNSGRNSYLRRRSRSRSRSRRRDNSEDRIDKKRLLEIARKNAILMLKNGTLPGTQNLAPDAKEKVLAKMRYGGRSRVHKYGNGIFEHTFFICL